ncbi:hypothetical protein A3Q56_02657 [Intoshia linei]|uniref:Uncharacterized protein n=1 Tax=Intoshia linei TaxID=1819745 RepID=A0A177B784_9BILA|nr:hypothetical protein A3Q56_02657 [Intoshia linei]
MFQDIGHWSMVFDDRSLYPDEKVDVVKQSSENSNKCFNVLYEPREPPFLPTSNIDLNLKMKGIKRNQMCIKFFLLVLLSFCLLFSGIFIYNSIIDNIFINHASNIESINRLNDIYQKSVSVQNQTFLNITNEIYRLKNAKLKLDDIVSTLNDKYNIITNNLHNIQNKLKDTIPHCYKNESFYNGYIQEKDIFTSWLPKQFKKDQYIVGVYCNMQNSKNSTIIQRLSQIENTQYQYQCGCSGYVINTEQKSCSIHIWICQHRLHAL